MIATDGNPASISTYASLLLQALRQVHRYRLHLERERLRHRQTRSVLHVAVKMLAEHDAKLDSARETSQRLRDELRRYIAAQVEPKTTSTTSTSDREVAHASSPGVH
jgi:hypothetical protein